MAIEKEVKWTPGHWVVDIVTQDELNGYEYETDIEISVNGEYVHGHGLGYNDDTDEEIKANAHLSPPRLICMRLWLEYLIL